MTGTATELSDYIGREGRLSVRMGPVDTLHMPIVVIDAKRAYGNLRFRVRPHDSRPDSGAAWVAASRVELDQEGVKR